MRDRSVNRCFWFPDKVVALGRWVGGEGSAYKPAVFSVGQVNVSGLDGPRPRRGFVRVPSRIVER